MWTKVALEWGSPMKKIINVEFLENEPKKWQDENPSQSCYIDD